MMTSWIPNISGFLRRSRSTNEVTLACHLKTLMWSCLSGWGPQSAVPGSRGPASTDSCDRPQPRLCWGPRAGGGDRDPGHRPREEPLRKPALQADRLWLAPDLLHLLARVQPLELLPAMQHQHQRPHPPLHSGHRWQHLWGSGVLTHRDIRALLRHWRDISIHRNPEVQDVQVVWRKSTFC